MSSKAESSSEADYPDGTFTDKLESELEDLLPKIDTLKNCQDYTTQESFDAFELLSGYSENNLFRSRLAEHVANLGVADIFPVAWKQLKAATKRGEEGDVNLRILLKMKSLFTNLTDSNADLCQQLGQQGTFKLLFEEFATDFQDVEEFENNMMKEQFEASLGILHNCIRLWKDNRTLYREAEAVQLLTKYVRSNHSLVTKTKCLLILSYVVNEEESRNLATHDGSVTYLLDLLKKAMTNPEHRIHCGDVAFSVAELMDGLNHVAENDANKVKIVEGGGVSMLSEIIVGESFSDEEHTLSARGLWRLAFVVSNREIIKKQRNVLQVLGAFRTSSVGGLREAGEGALWEIHNSSVREEGQKADESKSASGHVMISYQWQAQEMMKHLKEGLDKAGFNVWIDIDKAEGNMLDAMANAVENATVVLVAVSQKYKDSLNCRSEASYAYRLKKPMIPIMVEEGYRPDGWLGIVIAMNKYYRCYNDKMIDEQLPALIHELKDIGCL